MNIALAGHPSMSEASPAGLASPQPDGDDVCMSSDGSLECDGDTRPSSSCRPGASSGAFDDDEDMMEADVPRMSLLRRATTMRSQAWATKRMRALELRPGPSSLEESRAWPADHRSALGEAGFLKNMYDKLRAGIVLDSDYSGMGTMEQAAQMRRKDIPFDTILAMLPGAQVLRCEPSVPVRVAWPRCRSGARFPCLWRLVFTHQGGGLQGASVNHSTMGRSLAWLP